MEYFKPAGVAIMYTPKEFIKFGYLSDDKFDDAILFYEAERSPYRWYYNSQMKDMDILFDRYIKEELDIEEGKEKYPELFL